MPLFFSHIKPDLYFVGFEVSITKAKGSSTPNASNPGWFIAKTLLFFVYQLFLVGTLFAQSGNINKYNIINATKGNLTEIQNPDYNQLGNMVLATGDIDNDGVCDVISRFYNKQTLEGNLLITFLNKDFTVKSSTRIAANVGGFNGTFPNSMQLFGLDAELMGDINKDGVNDLIVSNFSGGGNGRGECYLLFLNNNGTVKKYTYLGSNNFSLMSKDYFGGSISAIGDIDKDGINEVAISSTGKENGAAYNGIIYIVYFDSLGNIKRTNIISSKSGNFNGVVTGAFGRFLCPLGDLNKDGNNDLMAMSYFPIAFWVLFLDSSAKVKSYQKIGSDSGGYTDTITSTELLGYSMTNMGDIDGDGNTDIAVSSTRDSVNGLQTGRVRILFLNQDGTVKAIKRIDNNATNFSGVLKDGDNFGSGLSGGFDLDGDFKNDLLVGAFGTDDGGTDKGAIYLLSLDGAVHPTPPKALWRVNTTSGNQNTVFNFTQYSTGFPSAYKWTISPNTFTYQNGTSDTSANPVIKFNETANYSVQLKVTNPFSADSLLRSSYISVQKVGVNNISKNATAISIYPNPGNGVVQIQSPVNIQAIVVFDITGKQLLQQTPHAQTDEINISHLPQGLYQIQVQTTTGVFVKKLVKE